jgi:hypothetical protein
LNWYALSLLGEDIKDFGPETFEAVMKAHGIPDSISFEQGSFVQFKLLH